MSIESQISRIEMSRNTIRAKLVELGMANSTDKLEVLAAAIEDLVNRGAVSITVKEGETVAIPAGYHNGSGTVSGVSGGGSYTLQSKSVTPTKKQQSVTPDSGYYGLSDVTVLSIPDAYQDVSGVTAAAGDVLTGKIIVLPNGTQTAGTMSNNGNVSKTLDATTISYTIPKGYHGGTGKVSIVLETKTVTPTKSTQTINPTSGKVLSKVTVNPIPDNYIDTGDANASAGAILAGNSAYVDGVKVDGMMPNNGNVSGSIDGLNATSVTIPAGYTSGGTITLTSDIEDALAEV